MKTKQQLSFRDVASIATGVIFCSLLLLILSYTILTMPIATGLSKEVGENMAVSGVQHPVTAVLMNFRGYDTFLELGVLFIAMVASLTVQLKDETIHSYTPSPVQHVLVHTIAPFIVLVATYLLWRGASGPGGAFQAGAILAACGVLILLSDWNITEKTIKSVKVVTSFGLLAFSATAFAIMLSGNQFLRFPPDYAGYLIVFIETFAMFSIASILIILFKPSLLKNQ